MRLPIDTAEFSCPADAKSFALTVDARLPSSLPSSPQAAQLAAAGTAARSQP